jgi:(2R)-3-sulfolactate dehydrogenase (NADP+)
MFSALTEDNEVRIPGARRAEARAHHEACGVDVPESLLEQIEALASAK